MTRAGAEARTSRGSGLDSVIEQELRRVLSAMRFGTVTLIVQDGRVVQIDTTHKLRIASGGSAPSGGNATQ